MLAIDTSTQIGSIALHDETGVIGILTASVNLTHSEGLMPAIDSLLVRTGKQREELTAIACVTGPGSYTGLRVGIATGQGLALPRRLPCVGKTAFEVLSWVMPHVEAPYCPLLPARKGWLYARLYRWNTERRPEAMSDELHLEPESLIDYIHSPTVLFGPGLPRYRDLLRQLLEDQFIAAPDVYTLPRADVLAELAMRSIREGNFVDAESLFPHYLGPSQAEVNWRRRKSTSG